MHGSIKSIKTEELIKCQNSFNHTLTRFNIAKSPENHKTHSKKLRQNFSLSKKVFLENKSRNEPFL